MGSKLMWHQGLKFLRLTSPLFVDQLIEVFAFRADSKLVFLSEWCSSTEFCIASKDSDQWVVCWGSRVFIPTMRRWTGAVPVPRDGMVRASYCRASASDQNGVKNQKPGWNYAWWGSSWHSLDTQECRGFLHTPGPCLMQKYQFQLTGQAPRMGGILASLQ